MIIGRPTNFPSHFSPSWDLPVVEPKGSKCHICGDFGHKALTCAQNPYRILDGNPVRTIDEHIIKFTPNDGELSSNCPETHYYNSHNSGTVVLNYNSMVY